jgi:NAD(P)-dependent dehydrogenase (short-subunit alcohol dehydrogenase family)
MGDEFQECLHEDAGYQSYTSGMHALPPDPHRLDRACLVTGAATRLGRVIALAMAKAGWDVAVHYRTSAQEARETVAAIRATGRDAEAFAADLSDAAEIGPLFDAVRSRFPRLSALINNASRFSFDRPEATSAALIQGHMAANLIAPTMLGQMLYTHLLPQHRAGQDPLGVIIHLLDQKLANPNPDFFAYTLSKSALLEATRLSAMAYAPVLRVVGVAPGITLASGDQTPEEFQKTHQMTPLGASSRPEEVADAVVWAAQARAVTGTMLLVDGGQHLMAQPRDVMMMIRT